MDLNLEAAFDEPVDLSHEFEIPTGRLDRPELLSLSPVAFTGRLERAELGFLLNGELSFSGVVACARCLAPVPFTRREEVSWTFMPAHEKPVEKARADKARAARPAGKGGKSKAEKNGDEDGDELSAADLDVVYYEELVVPFDPLIEEQLQLEMPMKALCRDDCRGLCPQCGADRNAAPCDCAPPPDERWKSLKTILQHDDKN
jgi:uncharacterized protein